MERTKISVVLPKWAKCWNQVGDLLDEKQNLHWVECDFLMDGRFQKCKKLLPVDFDLFGDGLVFCLVVKAKSFQNSFPRNEAATTCK